MRDGWVVDDGTRTSSHDTVGRDHMQHREHNTCSQGTNGAADAGIGKCGMDGTGALEAVPAEKGIGT